MAIPIEESIQLPLLRAIADAGGELPLKEAVSRVAALFPELTASARALDSMQCLLRILREFSVSG